MITLKKIKFINYDRYDRREALKKILDASYVRYKLNADEDMEAIDSDSALRNLFVAGQSSYSRIMNTVMKTFEEFMSARTLFFPSFSIKIYFFVSSKKK